MYERKLDSSGQGQEHVIFLIFSLDLTRSDVWRWFFHACFPLTPLWSTTGPSSRPNQEPPGGRTDFIDFIEEFETTPGSVEAFGIGTGDANGISCGDTVFPVSDWCDESRE